MRYATVLAVMALSSAAAAQEELSEEAGLFGLPGEWTSRGEVASESRLFPDDDKDTTRDDALGLFARLELAHEHGIFTERVRVLGRLDGRDDARSTFIVEEAFVQLKRGPLRLRVGADIVNWTATEAFHPADVLNARNLDSDVENYEKVGEPMVALQLSPWSGTTVDVFYLPVYMEPIMPSRLSRLNPVPPEVPLGNIVRLGRDGEQVNERFGHQGAVRLRQTIGSADLSVHYVDHLDRAQPAVGVSPVSFRVRPIFLSVRQVGGTYQQVFGPLIAKVEGSYRQFYMPDGGLTKFGFIEERDHGTAAVGFEYGVPHEGGSESTLLLEGQTLLGLSKADRAALSVFQRDVLVGYRFAFNDEDSRELLLTAIGDVEREEEYLLSATYGQRLGETWSVRLGVRLVQAKEPRAVPAGLESLRDADFMRLSLTRHF